MNTKRKAVKIRTDFLGTTGFKFDAENHRYYMDGKLMTGVTTVLSVLAKPALIQWAANEAAKAFRDGVMTLEEGRPVLEALDELYEKSRTAHARKRDDAATKGTDLHSLVESFVNYAIKEHGGAPLGAYPDAIKSFVEWAKQNKIRFIASEKQLYSKELFVAGTCDLVFEKDGKLWLGDVKTSSGIYPEHFYQAAAYKMMYEEMGNPELTGGLMIIRLGKDGSFETKERHDYLVDKSAFLGALAVYRANASYKVN